MGWIGKALAIVAALAGVGLVATNAFGAQGGNEIANWVYDDSEGRLSLALRGDGKCFIFLLEKRTNLVERVDCKYRIHGGRVKLRTWDGRDGEGYSRLEIEHRRDLNALVILGSTERVLVRQPPDARGE
ncbi:hypothetical protein BWI17_03635 [Betaproteobacteria bacterium GR16-43]|nr:hypothetical protein BWI17_03635 [Betaproteobacteria bacterium GR16-43]